MGAIAVEPAVRTATAPWGYRVAGALVDNVILGAVTFVAMPVAGAGAPSLAPIFGPPSTGEPWTSSPWVVGVLAAMLVMQAYAGATPGKLLLGIAVVRNGRPVGLGWTALRLVCHLLDAVLLVGYLRPLWNPARQTFADSIVGTHVVHMPRTGWRRGAAWVTAAATLVAVPLNVFPSQASTAFGSPCPETVLVPGSPHLTTVDVQYHPARWPERRLWIVREREDPQGGRLTISWADATYPSYEVRATVTDVTGRTTEVRSSEGTDLDVPAPREVATWTIESLVGETVTAHCTGWAPGQTPIS